MTESLPSGAITVGVITLISLAINIVTIYRWVADYLQRESRNDQAFHMIMGLANSVTKRTGMVVRRINIMKEQGRDNEESMILLENAWSDSMATADNLLAAAKALKPKMAPTLPYNAEDLFKRSQKVMQENQSADVT